MDGEIKAHNKKAYELISSWLKTLTPDQATDVWLYLDGADIMELIEVVAPLSPEFGRTETQL